MSSDRIELRDVLSRLQKVKGPRNGRWMACCPAHQDRTPSLAVTVRPGGRVLVKCFSNNCPEASIWAAMGFGDGRAVAVRPTDRPRQTAAVPTAEIAAVLARYQRETTTARLDSLSRQLGVSVASLRRVGACYAADKVRSCDVWAFPMVDADGRPVGIRYRDVRGKKFALVGGREGLFIDAGLSPDGPVCMCEGPTSLAALLDLGFPAIARPSCNGGVALVKAFLARRGRCDVVILGDNDEGHPTPDGRGTVRPGQDGAYALKREVADLCRTVRVVIPPTWKREGREHRVKDMRDWLREGATYDVVAPLFGRPFFVRKLSA